MFRRSAVALTAGLALCIGQTLAETKSADPGITDVASPRGVNQSLDRLESILEAEGVTVFPRTERSAEAAK